MVKQPSRDPGSEIKYALRREVNYGCPVRFADGTGCGSPVLTYHHFDPPWAGNFIHNQDGMLALCPEHHTKADGGHWTKRQLREMKTTPYVDDVLKVQWPWGPETLVIKVGSCLIVGSGSPIRLNGKRVLGFTPHKNENLGGRTVLFDSDLRDQRGARWLRIENGWFDLGLENTTDVVFTPQSKTFKAVHADKTHMSWRFRKRHFNTIKEWTTPFLIKPDLVEGARSRIEETGAIDSDGFVPIFEFEGHFNTREVTLDVRGDQMSLACHMPGFMETLQVPACIVDDVRRLSLVKDNARNEEFFGVG
jgi:hypothetical protein